MNAGSITRFYAVNLRHLMPLSLHAVSPDPPCCPNYPGLTACIEWQSSAPFCKRGCSGDRKELTYSTWGAGGEEPCATGHKSLCCTQPPPYQNCEWYKHGGKYSLFTNPFSCSGKCPSGKQMIASDVGSCFTGYQVYCCDSPASECCRPRHKMSIH